MIPATGQIRFSDLRNLFKGSAQAVLVTLADHYQNAPSKRTKNVTVLPNIGAPISTSQFRGLRSLSPSDLPGTCSLWIDADTSPCTLDASNGVISISDKVNGKQYAPGGSGGVRPIKTTQFASSLNGRSVIRFNTATSSPLVSTTAVTWGTKWNVFYIINPFLSSGGMYLAYVNVYNGDYVYVPGGANYNARGNTQTYDVNANFSYETDGVFNVRFMNYPTGPRYNGAARSKTTIYSVNPPAPSSAEFRLCSSGSTTYANVCEIFIFDRDMTSSEIEKMEGYLAWKWGLQSKLPATHTYYDVQPYTV